MSLAAFWFDRIASDLKTQLRSAAGIPGPCTGPPHALLQYRGGVVDFEGVRGPSPVPFTTSVRRSPPRIYLRGESDFMAYVSEWERLSKALTRVMAAGGLPEDEAQTDICRAIAEGAVEIRGKLKKQSIGPMSASNTVLEGKDFHISSEIKPEDLDWEGFTSGETLGGPTRGI